MVRRRTHGRDGKSLTALCRYFNRDVECIRRFFRRRFRYESVLYPRFSSTMKDGEKSEEFKLDVVVAASGFTKKDMSTLEEVNPLIFREGVLLTIASFSI